MKITKEGERTIINFNGTLILTKNNYGMSISKGVTNTTIQHLKIFNVKNGGFKSKIKTLITVIKFIFSK